jgi:ribosomal protein S18 acetylase RimI-like enzyme
MRSGAITILPMKRSHIQACNAIVTVSEPWRTLGEEVDFRKYISSKQAFICDSEDGPAGFIIFTADPVFARGGYIRAIGVNPAMRGQGIGTKLLVFAESMTARQSRNMYLCVSSFNRRGLHFYKKNGYIRVGKIPGLIRPDASEHILWKRLKPSR